MKFAGSLNEKLIISQFARMNKMSYSQFYSWLEQYGSQAYEIGLEEGQEVGELWTDVQIYELLRSEHIGQDRAVRIVEKLLEGFKE